MSLAAGAEPLVLADGTKIDPKDGTVVVDSDYDLIEVPTMKQVQREYVMAQRRLSDLPVPPHKLNTISLVLCYSLLGISDKDIGVVLGLEEEQVGRVRMSDSFLEIREEVVQSVIESDQEAVRGMISQSGLIAATRMIETLNSEDESMRVSAAKDLLDRSGHRPADVIEHRHKLEGGLRIEYVTKDEGEVPTIDITPEDVM